MSSSEDKFSTSELSDHHTRDLNLALARSAKLYEVEIANRDRALDSFKEATKNISSLVKYIGFGLVAAFYALRPEISVFSQNSLPSILHISMGMIGFSVILSDYLHYTFSARTAK